MITSKEIKDLAKAMHASGVVSLKTPEIELLIQPKPVQVRRKRVNPMLDTPDTLKEPNGTFRGYTEEELLTWSSAPVGNENAQDNETI
jgi:hypothetical protein